MGFACLSLLVGGLTGCSNDNDDFVFTGPGDEIVTPAPPTAPVGAVFAMTNGPGQPSDNSGISGPNSIVSYARAADGSLSFVNFFDTGGFGGDFDSAEGLDPLISANAIELTPDNQFLLVVNAGGDGTPAAAAAGKQRTQH